MFSPGGDRVQGSDRELFRILAKALGFRPSFLKRPKDNQQDYVEKVCHLLLEETFTLAPDFPITKHILLLQLRNGTYDVGLGNYVIHAFGGLRSGLRFAGPLYVHDLRLNCPRPGPLPPLMNLARAYRPGVWVLAATALAAACALGVAADAVAARRRRPRPRQRAAYVAAALKLYGSQFAQGECSTNKYLVH